LKSQFPEKVETLANATVILGAISAAATKLFSHLVG
jgi:hypothetical protein